MSAKDMNSPQYAKADLAIAIKVGIEADSVVSGSDQLDPWRVDGVVRGTAEQEEEKTTLIWRVKWPCDQGVDLSGMTEAEHVDH